MRKEFLKIWAFHTAASNTLHALVLLYCGEFLPIVKSELLKHFSIYITYKVCLIY